MTTTDARKRNRDMADAHETAQARDAAWMLAALDGTGESRTRTHSINPETGEFTPLDFHREWLHVMDTQHPHTPQETDMPNNQRRHREQMGVLDQIQDLLTEIRDRLPEREVACGDVWRDETERPCTRPSGHDGNHVDKVGTIWANPEPAPADVDPDEAGGEGGPEPKAELDEVEALAKVLRRVWTSRDNWDDISCEARDEYRRMARVAREHLDGIRNDCDALLNPPTEGETDHE